MKSGLTKFKGPNPYTQDPLYITTWNLEINKFGNLSRFGSEKLTLLINL